MPLSFILPAGLLILALTLFATGVLRFWNAHWGDQVSSIQRRLNVISGEASVNVTSLMKSRLLSLYPWMNQFLKKIPAIGKLDILLLQSGKTWRVDVFVGVMCVLSLVLLTGTLLIKTSMNLSMVVFFAPELMAGLYLVRKRNQRVVKIQEQLPDTLDLIARAMQAGHAFSSALLIVGSEGSSPIRDEFQMTFDEINFGIPTHVALHHLEQRVASSDLRFFVVAVLIQLETGGNLTDILKSLSGLIRDRQRIAGAVRILSAEGRLSAWILGILPFGIAAMLSVINPEFISKLWTDSLGIRMLEVSLFLMVTGIWWMWHMVRVKD